MQKKYKKNYLHKCMNVEFEQNKILKLLQHPLKNVNLVQIVEKLQSINCIVIQKKIFKLLGVNISIKKIKEFNIFGLLTDDYLNALKSRQFDSFVYSFNLTHKIIPCSIVKEILYKKAMYDEGYAYINPKTINIYIKKESYIIKYDSIESVNITKKVVIIKLKNTNLFKFLIDSNDSDFIQKFEEKIYFKIIVNKRCSNDESQFTKNPKIMLQKQKDTLCKLAIPSPDNTTFIKFQNSSLSPDNFITNFQHTSINLNNTQCKTPYDKNNKSVKDNSNNKNNLRYKKDTDNEYLVKLRDKNVSKEISKNIFVKKTLNERSYDSLGKDNKFVFNSQSCDPIHHKKTNVSNKVQESIHLDVESVIELNNSLVSSSIKNKQSIKNTSKVTNKHTRKDRIKQKTNNRSCKSIAKGNIKSKISYLQSELSLQAFYEEQTISENLHIQLATSCKQRKIFNNTQYTNTLSSNEGTPSFVDNQSILVIQLLNCSSPIKNMKLRMRKLQKIFRRFVKHTYKKNKNIIYNSYMIVNNYLSKYKEILNIANEI